MPNTYKPSQMAGAIRRLANGMAEEPFIESQATSYFNTGVAGNTVYGIELEFMPVTIVTSYQCYAIAATNDFTVGSMDTSAGVTSGFIRCGSVDFGAVTFLRGVKNVLSCMNGTVTLNGQTISGSYSGPINTTSDEIKLLGSQSTNPYALSHARVFRCKFYDQSGNLIHYYIPHIDSNYIPCLKDNVTNNILYGSNNRLTYSEGYKIDI